jgi:hypothetical protein
VRALRTRSIVWGCALELLREQTPRVINLSERRAIWYAARRSSYLVEDSSTGYAQHTTPLNEGFYAIFGSGVTARNEGDEEK